jgi:hypothetical protein
MRKGLRRLYAWICLVAERMVSGARAQPLLHRVEDGFVPRRSFESVHFDLSAQAVHFVVQ